MKTIIKEKAESLKCITKLLTKWIKEQGTSEKANLLLLKNQEIKLSKIAR
jgi:hypothetical protein